jgi:hypothetical protein
MIRRPPISTPGVWWAASFVYKRPALASAGVDTLELATDDDLQSAILRFADLRKQRSRLANWSGNASRMPAHISAAKAAA